MAETDQNGKLRSEVTLSKANRVFGAIFTDRRRTESEEFFIQWNISDRLQSMSVKPRDSCGDKERWGGGGYTGE